MVVDLKASKKRISGAVLWSAAVLLALAVAYPAWAVIFAPKNSVLTKSIAKNAVTSAKIKNGAIVNADISAAAAIAASKINTAGLNADSVDGKHAADFVSKTGDQSMGGALTAGNFNYSAPRTRYLSIPAAKFVPVESSTTFSYDATGGLVWGGGGSDVFRAPVELPHGATITNFRFTARDDVWVPMYYVAADLTRWSVGGSNEVMAENTTAGLSAPGWVDLDIAVVTNSTIDNSKYSYFVAANFDAMSAGSAMQIGSVVITYTVPAP